MPRVPSPKATTAPSTPPPAATAAATGNGPGKVAAGGGQPAPPLPTVPISTKEEDLAFAPLLDEAQKAALAKVDAPVRMKLRDLSRTLRNLRRQGSDLKKRKDALTREWLGLIEDTGLGGVPCVDPVTREPLIAYRRVDEMLHVEPADLREFLYEHYKVTLGEEEDVAAGHALDIMGQVLKPEAIDLDVFRKLVENGTIDGQVAAAASQISYKAAWVDFVKATTAASK